MIAEWICLEMWETDIDDTQFCTEDNTHFAWVICKESEW